MVKVNCAIYIYNHLNLVQKRHVLKASFYKYLELASDERFTSYISAFCFETLHSVVIPFLFNCDTFYFKPI